MFGSFGTDMLEGCVESSRGSETNFEEYLTLSGRVGLARRTQHDAIHGCGTHPSKVCSVINAGVGSANLHTVQDVGEFHSQFSPYAFTEKEFFGEGEIFVALEWAPQVTQNARLITGCEPRIRKGSRIEDGQALVIVVVVDA
jgi:hypothetical protein